MVLVNPDLTVQHLQAEIAVPQVPVEYIAVQTEVAGVDAHLQVAPLLLRGSVADIAIQRHQAEIMPVLNVLDLLFIINYTK